MTLLESKIISAIIGATAAPLIIAAIVAVWM